MSDFLKAVIDTGLASKEAVEESMARLARENKRLKDRISELEGKGTRTEADALGSGESAV